MQIRRFILAGAVLAIPASALAHHSFAMFDADKNIAITGVVKEFEWTNPHVWIHILAADKDGKPQEWSFEMQAVAQDAAVGWRKDSVKAGDKVSIEFHPLKDGTRGGQLTAATLANGQRLGRPAGGEIYRANGGPVDEEKAK